MPHLGDDHRDKGQRGVVQPFEIDRAEGDPAEHLIDRAVILKQHEPGVADDDRHDHHRRQQRREPNAFAPEFFQEQSGQPEADDEFEAQADHRHDHGAAERLQITRLVGHQIIVADALIYFLRENAVKSIPEITINRLPFGQADDEFQKERKNQHHAQQNLHRRDQETRDYSLVVGIEAAGFP